MDTGVDNAPGSFCWTALSTPHPRGAAEFYSEVFGWTLREEQPFWTFWLGDERVASIVKNTTDERSRGMPPNWMPFVRVLDVDQMLERASELGGKIWFPGFEGPDARLGLISGVTGEIIGMWQTPIGDRPALFGAQITGFHELVTPDPEPAKRFYEALFGWRFTNEGTYTVMTNGAQPIGGVVKMEGDWEDHTFLEAIGQAPGKKWDIPPHWMPYFKVRDCEETLRRAEALTARVLSRPDDLHTFGQFAVARDPQGAYFSILSRM